MGLINILIALCILNVWLFRFNKKTAYRGGNAKNMKEEFREYGLPMWSMYLIGSIKVILSIVLIIGIWTSKINIYTYIFMSILMTGSIFMHLKINDPIKKSVPAITILCLLLVVIFYN